MTQSLVAQTPRLTLNFPWGLNENEYPNLGEAFSGYNFELGFNHQDFNPRPPFDLKGTAPNAGSINGLCQLVKRDNSQTTIVAASTIWYKWDGSTFTSLGAATANSGSKYRDVYWSLGDYLVITDVNKADVVRKWDGTSISNLTTGLAVPLYAKFGIVHLNRMWLFNCTTNTAVPHLMVASAFEDPTTYDVSKRGGPTNQGGASSFTTGLEAFYLLTPDLKPINAVAVIGYDLCISTTGGRIFKLTGSDSKTFQFTDFYDAESAVSDEAMANVGNDIYFMRNGGRISSLSTTEFAGNAKAAELSSFLPDTIQNLTSCQIAYDKGRQKVYFFTTVGKVLVLFKDLLPSGFSPWSIYKTTDSGNFSTNVLKYMYQPGTTDLNVFWGDSTGRILMMDGTGAGDAGSKNIDVLRETRLIDQTILNPWPYNVEIIEGRVKYLRIGQFDLTLSFNWQDEYNTSNSIVTLKGPLAGDTAVYWGGSHYWGQSIYWNQGFQATRNISSRGFSPTGKGPGFFLSLSTSTTVQYEVDEVQLY